MATHGEDAATTPILQRATTKVRLRRPQTFPASGLGRTESFKNDSLMRFFAIDLSGARDHDKENGMANGTGHWTQRILSMSPDRTYNEDDRTVTSVGRDSVKPIITKHVRSSGGKAEVLEDLELGRINVGNALEVLRTFGHSELNAFLLYASFLGRGELVPYFHAAGADLSHAEPEEGLTALHLCALSDSLFGAKYLVDKGVDVDSKKIYTPFQYAAFGNAYNVAKYFFLRGVSQENVERGDTVLHSAAKSRALHVIKLIAPNNPTLNRLDRTGHAPIHYVAAQDDTVCLVELLRAGCEVDAPTTAGCTALHLAAAAGCYKNVEILLDNGANASLKLSRGHTALHLAARILSYESVDVLLRKGMVDPDAVDDDGWTALHFALANSLSAADVCSLLITKMADVNKADNTGCSPLHTAVLWAQHHCVEILIHHGSDLSAKTVKGRTALSLIRRESPASLNGFKRRLDDAIGLHQPDTATGEVELILDFSPLLKPNKDRETSYVGTFVKGGYKDILEHPLCQSFLHLKWQTIRKFYFGRLAMHSLHVFVLTAWVLTALAHNCYNESHDIYENATEVLCQKTALFDGYVFEHPKLMDVIWHTLMTLTTLEQLRILLRPLFVKDPNFKTMLAETCVIISIFATCFLFSGRTYAWQSHVGAYAVLLSWLKMMLMIGQLPMFGVYVAMFTSIQVQVFKLLLAYTCLLIGFAASFCVIFPYTNAFSNPLTALMKVVVMMIGEFEFESLFFPEEAEDMEHHAEGTYLILLHFSAHVCFLLFLLFVTIVLMNLMIGIAVNDIEGLEKTAVITKLVHQTSLICDVERSLLLGRLPRRLLRWVGWSRVIERSRVPRVITVYPFSPTERRLPPDVLAAAHRIARDNEMSSSQGTYSSKRSNNTTYTNLTSDANSIQRRGHSPLYDDNSANENVEKLQEQMTELKKICDENQKLIQDLVAALRMTGRRQMDRAPIGHYPDSVQV